MSYNERVVYWTEALGPAAAGLGPVIAETARRFRYEAETIDRVARGIGSLHGDTSPATITTACRAAARLELGDMAQPVVPRFDSTADLFLAPKQAEQFREVLHAMRSLTEVHYGWGTARAWNERRHLGAVRGPAGHRQDDGRRGARRASSACRCTAIDLSQVVNKYIGETEKNLRRIFDAADARRRAAVLRRSRRAVRQAHRGQGRARPLREPRGQLPARAHGALQRPCDPRHQPQEGPRRSVPAPPALRRRIPAAGRRAAPAHLAPVHPRRRRRVELDLAFLATAISPWRADTSAPSSSTRACRARDHNDPPPLGMESARWSRSSANSTSSTGPSAWICSAPTRR